jgi:hypothetical protein
MPSFDLVCYSDFHRYQTPTSHIQVKYLHQEKKRKEKKRKEKKRKEKKRKENLSKILFLFCFSLS